MAPAADAASHFQEGFMNRGKSLDANTQTLEVVQPGDGSFDGTAGLPRLRPFG